MRLREIAITSFAVPTERPDAPGLDDVDGARAALYRLLAHALAGPPSAGLLERMARLRGDEGGLGAALSDLARVAAQTPLAQAQAEHDVLFIGVARGELLPYASFYLTGFLHERPLARLRGDLSRLGLARAEGRSDPEDHIATVCDVMATLIERGDAEAEAGFFARHVAPWAGAFFDDLAQAGTARLYRPLGLVGLCLIGLDQQGFAYAGPTTSHALQGAA